VVVSNFSAKLLTSSFVMEPILRSLCEPFAPAATLPIVGGGGVEFAFEVVDARAAAVPSSSLLMRGDRSASASISPCARTVACGNMDCNVEATEDAPVVEDSASGLRSWASTLWPLADPRRSVGSCESKPFNFRILASSVEGCTVPLVR